MLARTNYAQRFCFVLWVKMGQVFIDIVHLEVKKKKCWFKKLCRGDIYSCKKKKKGVSEIKPQDNILKNKRKCLTARVHIKSDFTS